MKIDFEMIVESAPDAILVVSQNGSILLANAEAEKLFGYSRQELIHGSIDRLIPESFHELHVKARQNYNRNPTVRPMGSRPGIMGRRADGREIPVEICLSPTSQSAVVAIIRDITARKIVESDLRDLTNTLALRLSELKLQTNILQSVLDSIGDAVIVLDRAGRFLLLNASAKRIHRIARALSEPVDLAEAIKKFGLFMPDKITPCSTRDLPLSRVLNGEIVDGQEIFVRRSSTAQGIWITVTARPLIDASRNLAGGVLVIRNITSRKSSQEALLLGQEAERSRISRELHDSVSQNICSLVLELENYQRELPASAAEVRTRINSHKQRLMDVGEEVTAVARKLHPSVLERFGLVQAMRELCKDFTTRRGLRVRFTERELNLSISAAFALCLYRVAQEVLHNVQRHARTSQASVDLGQNRGRVYLIIEDAGVGFDPKNTPGRGLGLLSIRERVRLAGGTLLIQSQPGKGTRIELRGPRQDTQRTCRESSENAAL
jgi:PAS domain S-box-containing protein